MLFSSVSQLISNITRLTSFGSTTSNLEALFQPRENKSAYWLETKHMKTCNSEYVKGCQLWLDKSDPEQQLQNRGKRRRIAKF